TTQTMPLSLHDALPISSDAATLINGAIAGARQAMMTAAMRHGPTPMSNAARNAAAASSSFADRGTVRCIALVMPRSQTFSIRMRSEEHTSELQSRENRV